MSAVKGKDTGTRKTMDNLDRGQDQGAALAGNLQRIRIERRMSISQLAELCGATEAEIAAIEAQEMHIDLLGIGLVERLSDVLGVSLPDLLEFKRQHVPKVRTSAPLGNANSFQKRAAARRRH